MSVDLDWAAESKKAQEPFVRDPWEAWPITLKAPAPSPGDIMRSYKVVIETVLGELILALLKHIPWIAQRHTQGIPAGLKVAEDRACI